MNFDISKVDPPNRTEIDLLLKSKVDVAFKTIGLSNVLNNRVWFSDFDNNGLKSVVRFQLTKGLGAVFVFGKCFEFLPTISNSHKLINHKTDKSTTLHLFDYTDSIIIRPKFGKPRQLLISVTNKSDFSKGLDLFLKFGLDKIKSWFEANQTIENCIETGLKQLSVNEQYSLHSPNQNYVLSYLYSKQGKPNEANAYLEKFLEERYDMLNEEIETKIRERIHTLANNV